MSLLDIVVERVESRLLAEKKTILLEASGRHVHLCQEHVEALFGVNYQLTVDRYLSQPHQFAAKERLTLIGSKGIINNVVILGPARKETQVELSATDGLTLGTKLPVRESGAITGTPGIVLMNAGKCLPLAEGVIVAKRHIHMTEQDASELGVKHGEKVQVRVMSEERPLIFADVIIRVSNKFKLAMHIDYDEANACGFYKGMEVQIIK